MIFCQIFIFHTFPGLDFTFLFFIFFHDFPWLWEPWESLKLKKLSLLWEQNLTINSSLSTAVSCWACDTRLRWAVSPLSSSRVPVSKCKIFIFCLQPNNSFTILHKIYFVNWYSASCYHTFCFKNEIRSLEMLDFRTITCVQKQIVARYLLTFEVSC